MVTKHARQNNYRVCKTKKTTHVCSVCSELKGEDVWICHTSAARDCFMEHLAHCHDYKVLVVNIDRYALPQLSELLPSIEEKYQCTRH